MAKKDKNTASFISLVFGWIGLQQIYLRQPGKAIFFILPLLLIKPLILGFFVAAMMGFVNALFLMMMSPEQFDKKYNEGQGRPGSKQWDRRRDYSRRDYQREQRWEKRHQARREPVRRPSSTRQRPIRNGSRSVDRRKANPFKVTGMSKYKEYDYDEAIHDFKKALELEPNDIATHFNIACAYSLTEQPAKSLEHLHRAVKLGFSDFEKIRTHDDLAFIRIQPDFVEFEKNGFKLGGNTEAKEEIDPAPNDVLLSQLQKLAELREKGLITEQEYIQEKRKLSR